MRNFLILSLLFFVFETPLHASSELDASGISHRHLVLSLEERSDPLFSGSIGWRLGIGYLWRSWEPELRISQGPIQYESIQAHPDPSLTPSGTAISDINSELLRTRLGEDLWNYFLYEPGLSVTGKFFLSPLQDFTEKVRFGVAWGQFTDVTHAVEFTTLLYSFETALSYPLGLLAGPLSPLEISVAFTLHSGVIVSNSPVPETKQERRLPIQFYSASFGILYWF